MGHSNSTSETTSGSCSAGLTLEDWTGSWELDRRENWDTYLAFLGVPEAAQEAAKHAPDFHKYRVDTNAFTMDHQIPAQKMYLRFRADLDGEWRESPYPRPTVAYWAADGEQTIPEWRNYWSQEPICFKTEIPNFMGKEGKTLTIERQLTSSASIKMTVNIHEGEHLVVGPCYTYMRKMSSVGPLPISWLRAHGNSLATVEERIEALEQAFKMISENLDAISAAQEKDRVVPPRFDGTAKMIYGAIRFYQKLIPQWMTPELLEDTCPAILKDGVDAEFKVINEPKGVCAVIVPWNAPVTLALIPALGMLAAGNRVAIKPAELVPAVSAVLRRLCHKYLPSLVWVEEGGKEAVERLIDEGADHLVFTGGAEVAKVVAARCAQTLTPVTLELGGKSPVFVDRGLEEAMLDNAIREIFETKVYKTGQFCCAHDYALVHEDIYDAFCAKLRAAVEALGDRRNVLMIGRRHYESVKQKLLEADADVLPPLVDQYKPNDEAMTLPFTALLSPAPDKSVLTQEIFGPIMPVVKVKTVEEAIDVVSGPLMKQPLIAYCYSQDSSNVDAFVAGISAGNVAVNAGPQRLQLNYNCAFGGVGRSGSGVHMWGREALREFSNRKHVINAKDGFAKSFFSGPPAQPA